MWLTAVITLVAAYLIGSVNFAVIFTKAFTNKDVREYGSGNAGTTNVMRVGGRTAGVLTFVCDVLKGFAASLLGKFMFEYIAAHSVSTWAVGIYGAYICGIFCIIGHVFPLFFDFKGGKGVATGVGIYAVCCPIAIAVGLCVFAALRLITKIVSVSSIVSVVVVIILSLLLYNEAAAFWPQALFSFIMGAIIILKHSDNIKRLISGEEKNFGFKR